MRIIWDGGRWSTSEFELCGNDSETTLAFLTLLEWDKCCCIDNYIFMPSVYLFKKMLVFPCVWQKTFSLSIKKIWISLDCLSDIRLAMEVFVESLHLILLEVGGIVLLGREFCPCTSLSHQRLAFLGISMALPPLWARSTRVSKISRGHCSWLNVHSYLYITEEESQVRLAKVIGPTS